MAESTLKDLGNKYGTDKASGRKNLHYAATVYPTYFEAIRNESLTLLEIGIGACAVCLKQEKLYVDHCHDSEKIRGLLCVKCNTGLGMLNDSVDMLDAAKRYLLLCKL